MKKLKKILLLFFLAVMSTNAQAQYYGMNYYVSQNSGHRTDVQLWADTITAQGGTSPSEAQLTLIDELIDSLDNAGILSVLDGFFILAQDGSQIASEVNFINPGGDLDLIRRNSPVWTSNVGYTPPSDSKDGIGYDMNNTTLTMTNWGTNAHCFGVVVDTAAANGSAMYMGNYFTGEYNYIYQSGSNFFGASGASMSEPTGGARGVTMFTVNRTASNDTGFFIDTTEEKTNTNSPNAADYGMGLGLLRASADWSTTYVSNNAGYSISFVFYGGDLTESQISTLYNSIINYLNSI